MVDREKVISALQRCRLMNKVNCDKCPYDYNGRGNGKSECTAELADDVLALLKEQDCNCCGTVFDVAYKAGKADAVVRCKDCKHRGDRNKCIVAFVAEKQEMPYFFYDNRGEWFCADGERKDNTK